MRQLRFVRTAEDGSQLLLETADGAETFLLATDAVRTAVGADLPRLSPSASITTAAWPPAAAPAREAPRPTDTPEIGPRDIQVRIRAGESPQELADSLGVPVERINRFAAPVVEERLRIADEARRARARRSVPEGIESKLVVFGEAVDDRFTAHGIVPADVLWDTYRREDGEWVISATWQGGSGTHGARWIFHRSSRSVTPLDETAADLLSDRPIRPITPPEPPAERVSLAAAPPLVHGTVAFPPMPDAHTGPMPVVEDVFDQEAPAEGPRDVPPLLPSSDIGLQFEEPPLPLGITDPSTRPAAAARLASVRSLGHTPAHRAGKRDESDEERAARVKVPSWDDILLGVRRKQD